MAAGEPRLAPLEEAEWTDEQRDLLAPMRTRGTVYNIFKTLVRYPKLLKRWMPFANHVLFKSSLSAREREMVILRVGWLARADYEWGHHVEIGRRAGLSDAEIARIGEGPEARGWTGHEAALLRAVDELHADCRIADPTWSALGQRYDTAQLMDLVFTVGNYLLVSMALNSLGVRLEPGFAGLPASRRR
jgi:4-carboxymuconolactone decarboxylase